MASANVNDRELLSECRRLAFLGEYDKAIEKARQISMPDFSIRAELLVIELQVSNQNSDAIKARTANKKAKGE